MTSASNIELNPFETPAPHLPVIGFCGFSGAGKTTLIEKLLQHYHCKGFRVAIIKHDVHGLVIDTPGKDSDRFFQAGADVVMRGPDQLFLRSHGGASLGLASIVTALAPNYDLIFLEGHKSTPHFDKVWLEKTPNDCPADTTNVKLTLPRDDNRFEIASRFLDGWIPRTLQRTPVHVGLIANEKDRRLLDTDDLRKKLLHLQEIAAGLVVLGPRPCTSLTALPHLAPLPETGEVFGSILAARRWLPLVNWLFLRPVDLAEQWNTVLESLAKPAEPTAGPVPSIQEMPFAIDFRSSLSLN